MQCEKNGKEPIEYIVLLKLELEEKKKIEDILKQQLTEGKNRCEDLEEVVTTRKELEKFQALYHQNLSSIKDLEELNNILSKQRSPSLKASLGYEEGSSNKQSECEHTMQTKAIETSTKIKNSDHNYQPRIAQKQIQQKGRQPRFRYQSFFHGYYYCCSNFGHKVANCAFNFRNI